MLRIVALAVLLPLLAACGLKGDLYLPPEPATTLPAAPPATDADTATDAPAPPDRRVPPTPDRDQAR
jgi:predicted small lipoprotein YifL